VNRVSHEVRRAGRAVELSPKEYALLEFLLRNPGHPRNPRRYHRGSLAHPRPIPSPTWSTSTSTTSAAKIDTGADPPSYPNHPWRRLPNRRQPSRRLSFRSVPLFKRQDLNKKSTQYQYCVTVRFHRSPSATFFFHSRVLPIKRPPSVILLTVLWSGSCFGPQFRGNEL